VNVAGTSKAICDRKNVEDASDINYQEIMKYRAKLIRLGHHPFKTAAEYLLEIIDQIREVSTLVESELELHH